MLTRSFLESYIGMLSSIYSILNPRSFSAARSYLWIDPPHCQDLRKLLQLPSRLWTLAKDSTRWLASHAESRGLKLRYRPGKRNAKPVTRKPVTRKPVTRKPVTRKPVTQ